MRRLLFLPLLAAAVAPSYASPAIDVLLPPGATAVFGIRTATLLNLIGQQQGAKDLRQQVAAMLAATPWSGFDPFRDIDEVVIAAMQGGKNPPTLAVITGRFDAEKLTHGKGHPYRNATLLEDTKSNQTLAFLGGDTVLGGDPVMVKAAIDRAAGNNSAGPLAARIESLRTRYDVWAFADRIDLGTVTGTPVALPGALKGLDRIWFGAAFARNFELSAELHFRNAKDVAEVTAMLRDLEKQAKAQMHGAAQLELSSTNDSVTMAVSIPENEWKRAVMEQFQAAKQGALTITSTESHEPPKPQVITTDPGGNTLTLSLPGKRR